MTVSLIFQIIMHASDSQEGETAHEYYADNPDFPAKTNCRHLIHRRIFGYLNDTLLNVALTPIMKDFGVDKTIGSMADDGLFAGYGGIYADYGRRDSMV